MFGTEDNSQKTNRPECEFVIVYDKFTKPFAISLRNSCGKNFKCVAWDKKVYLDNESKLSNWNNILFLNEELVNNELANPDIAPVEYTPGIDLLVEGNVVGLRFNPNTCAKNLSDIIKENWGKFLAATLLPMALGGILSPVLFLIYNTLLNSTKNKIKYASYFKAVEKLKKEGVEKYFYEK